MACNTTKSVPAEQLLALLRRAIDVRVDKGPTARVSLASPTGHADNEIALLSWGPDEAGHEYSLAITEEDLRVGTLVSCATHHEFLFHDGWDVVTVSIETAT